MQIMVVDTETTGLTGAPDDLVLDVGVVIVDTDDGSLMPVYSQIVGYDVDQWTDEQRHAWIFSHSDLTLDRVAAGRSAYQVRNEVRRLLAGRYATSYNIAFDFARFLLRPPWMVRTRLLPDIMVCAAAVVPGDHRHADGCSWPSLEKAYTTLCPEDPEDLHGPQAHRALSDAALAGHVLLALDARGAYPHRSAVA